MKNGVWDTELAVRPRWEDGTPAHTVKKFGIVNRYDLQREFPILTLRRTYWKSAVDELLWIWQKKSNNVHDLSSHIWDAWADESGSIGKAYGCLLYTSQLAVRVDLVEHRAQLRDLGHHVRHELLPAEARLDRHHQHDVALLEVRCV